MQLFSLLPMKFDLSYLVTPLILVFLLKGGEGAWGGPLSNYWYKPACSTHILHCYVYTKQKEILH